MKPDSVVRLRLAEETRAKCPAIARWRRKESVSEWLREFIEAERAAYEAALDAFGLLGQEQPGARPKSKRRKAA